ncbi:DMT family transporter [Kaistia dalseonensis]|uniref:Drug/metabolite transporter (DMT)-like permease n=1 Tax=Kaistia dalseonensis TaxID=410840 RepID=A0ABU0HB50_9HYPH|nr:DMT family transporter [Kaistia dalseonensis]MCX5496912.1 DMT family transporter [Kaistia dalseonensis]MDQ0439537.1 drug/metabolite transporter (DMT)-like permease [Kaistia dalseonensis]
MTAIAQAPSGDQAERILLGLSVSLVGNLMFATSDAIVKTLSGRYSVFQLVVTQAVFALVPLIIMVIRDGDWRQIRVQHPRLVFLRGLLAGTGTVFGFFAFSQLPLAETYSIFFCTPILVTILSIPILGERVGLHRWGAVILGLVGVIVMVRPGFATLHLGHAAALMASIIGAFTVLVMRRIAREERHAVMVMAVITGLIVVGLPGMIMTFRLPSPQDMLLFACGGLLMGSGQFFVVRSLSLAPASVIAPMQYSMMIWAIIYGLLLFGTAVDPFVVFGAMIVISSGLYIMHRERKRSRMSRLAAKGA